MKKPRSKIVLGLVASLFVIILIVASIYFYSRDPFNDVLIPPGHFAIEYLDQNEKRQYTTSPYFGEASGLHLHVHDENGREEFIMSKDLISLKCLNPTPLSEIEAWPKHFGDAGLPIPINYLEILDKKKGQRSLRIWATFWYYFRDAATGKQIGLHTGRVLRAVHNLTAKPTRVADLGLPDL